MHDTETAKQNVKDFVRRMLSIFTDPEASCCVLTRNDIEAMTVLVHLFGAWYIMSFLKANLSQSGLVVAFLDKLYETIRSQPMESQIVRQTKAFRSVLAIFIPSFQLPQDQKRRRTTNQISDKIRGPAFLPDKVTPQELASLIDHCEKLRLNDELLVAIRNECAKENIDTSVYESFLLPMLTSLLSNFPRRHIQIDTERYQKLYQTVCVAYTRRFVGLEPTRPTNWTRGPIGCHLSDLESHDRAVLNRFLANPRKNVVRFAMDLERRRHVEDQIKYQVRKRFLDGATRATDQSKPIARTRGNVSEFTLEITKTEAEWQQDLSCWRIRHAEAKRNIEAIGNLEDLQNLLSDENGIVTELKSFGLFEALQSVSKPLATGKKRSRENEGFSKIHGLD